eukprot:CAMPEP_0174379522 /NCGR_PEP_ID=MMETSP0811_2-20130205/122768_1 /TAXON_ID=73025 ORGANISM="Eutreptiella gymnastica-like, Strain CCMP1594" /NCGR_SAMPLE_ID=MMETSP0811_2 /ASSEMBLY_ACC=CAM_ASM_000667 /LENGTH=55 /DNA_ID=CAMNT_0015532093 /DNA_START=331 /DNA_END=498 /DNA_ORIENTATION=+
MMGPSAPPPCAAVAACLTDCSAPRASSSKTVPRKRPGFKAETTGDGLLTCKPMAE